MNRIALALVVLLVPASASAEYLSGDRSNTPDPATYPEVWDYQNLPREHDRGFLLRATVAPAWFASRTRGVESDIYGARLRLEGGGAELGLAVGGIVRPNLALHGTLTTLASIQPRIVVGDETGVAATPGFLQVGLGPGITGYLPANVWGSVSLGGSLVAFDFGDEPYQQPETGYGLFFEMAMGKEWWVGPYAGVGLFGRLTTHRAITDLAEPMGGFSISLGASFTLN